MLIIESLAARRVDRPSMRVSFENLNLSRRTCLMLRRLPGPKGTAGSNKRNRLRLLKLTCLCEVYIRFLISTTFCFYSYYIVHRFHYRFTQRESGYRRYRTIGEVPFFVFISRT